MANILRIIGKIFIGLSFVALFAGFVTFGYMFGVVSSRGTQFNVLAAIGGGIAGAIITCIPGVLLLGFSRLIAYTQLIAVYAEAEHERSGME
jgi:hypothetical protein